MRKVSSLKKMLAVTLLLFGYVSNAQLEKNIGPGYEEIWLGCTRADKMVGMKLIINDVVDYNKLKKFRADHPKCNELPFPTIDFEKYTLLVFGNKVYECGLQLPKVSFDFGENKVTMLLEAYIDNPGRCQSVYRVETYLIDKINPDNTKVLFKTSPYEK